MRQMTLGNSGISVSSVGLGGIQFSKISAAAVKRIIFQAFDCGITFFETAYGYFDSEEKMGPAIKARRAGLVLASKSGARDGPGFAKHLDESLRRLRTDYLDIYQLHGVDSLDGLRQAVEKGGAVEAAAKAIQAGKVRSLGITSHSLDTSLKALEMGVFETLQYPISLINTEIPRSGLLALAAATGTGLIAMKPMGGGRLGSARLALGYVYRHKNVVPVVGVETPEQVKELAAVAERPPKFSPADWSEIRRIRRTVGKTFCRACRYCEPCPQGISIFRAMYLPIYLKQMPLDSVLKDSQIPDWLAKVESCTACRKCEKRCPFHLHIVDGMKDSLKLARTTLAAMK